MGGGEKRLPELVLELKDDPTNSIVFLVDVDNRLLDKDRVQDDIKHHLEREFGAACRDRYWTILEQLFADLGYRDSTLCARASNRFKFSQEVTK